MSEMEGERRETMVRERTAGPPEGAADPSGSDT
jgi:hypothetical protein